MTFLMTILSRFFSFGRKKLTGPIRPLFAGEDDYENMIGI